MQSDLLLCFVFCVLCFVFCVLCFVFCVLLFFSSAAFFLFGGVLFVRRLISFCKKISIIKFYFSDQPFKDYAYDGYVKKCC